MPNQEPASPWIFGNSSVRVGTQGLFRPYFKTFVPPFFPTRLTAHGSPRMKNAQSIVGMQTSNNASQDITRVAWELARRQIACSAGVFFERAICLRKRHVETSRREEEMGRVPKLTLSQPRLQGFSLKKWVGKRPGDEVDTIIKSKMAATTILRTRTTFRPPKIRLHCRLGGRKHLALRLTSFRCLYC